MNAEKLQILNMISEGKVTPEEGLQLLNAIEGEGEVKSKSGKTPKKLKVQVMDGQKVKVNIGIPLSLLKMGINISKKFAPEAESELSKIDFDEIMQMIDAGAEGKLVDIETENGEIINIVLE